VGYFLVIVNNDVIPITLLHHINVKSGTPDLPQFDMADIFIPTKGRD